MLGRRVTILTITVLGLGLVFSGISSSKAQSLPSEKDLVGTWDIKDKASDSRIGTIEFLQNGQFKLEVKQGNGSKTFPASPKAKWKLTGANLMVAYDPNGRGKQVYMRGKINLWTKVDQAATFELPLRETNELPVREGAVLILDK
jgi:hypothetical protein